MIHNFRLICLKVNFILIFKSKKVFYNWLIFIYFKCLNYFYEVDLI